MQLLSQRTFYEHYPQFLYRSLFKIKNKNLGWASDEGQILKYLLNVPKTPIQVSGPHLSAITYTQSRFLSKDGTLTMTEK